MRVFIDCSKVDFSRQPTGIPRVVLRYIECGYAWAKKTGVEVMPVVTCATGLLPVRPLPGVGHPDYLSAYDDCRIEASAISPLIELSAHYLQSALVGSKNSPSASECLANIRELYRRMLSDVKQQPLELAEGDVLFCPAYWHDVDPVFFRAVQQRGVKIATLVHDILPITHSKFYQAPWKYQFEANLLEALRRSDLLLAVSNYTANSMREFANRKGLLDVHVEVAHNGHSPLVSPAIERQIKDGTFEPVVAQTGQCKLLRETQPFLMVGSIEPKKGHIPTIRAFEALWDAGLTRPLVIIGRKGWLEQSVVHSIQNCRYANKLLFWFEDFDDLDLYYAYRNSRGLIFSSYGEGFGIPMVEALSSGCPVVGFDCPINREVLGEFGLMFDDFVSFARHIRRLDNETEFESVQREISSFRWPTWPEIAEPLFDSFTKQSGRAGR